MTETKVETENMRVFDIGLMEELLRVHPAAALRLMAAAVDDSRLTVSLRNVMAIGGRGPEDTLRVTLDVSVQLVQLAKTGDVPAEIEAGHEA